MAPVLGLGIKVEVNTHLRYAEFKTYDAYKVCKRQWGSALADYQEAICGLEARMSWQEVSEHCSNTPIKRIKKHGMSLNDRIDQFDTAGLVLFWSLVLTCVLEVCASVAAVVDRYIATTLGLVG